MENEKIELVKEGSILAFMRDNLQEFRKDLDDPYSKTPPVEYLKEELIVKPLQDKLGTFLGDDLITFETKDRGQFTRVPVLVRYVYKRVKYDDVSQKLVRIRCEILGEIIND